MLSRIADHVYWMARYMERAENVARVLDVTHRMSLMARQGFGDTEQWGPPIAISADAKRFLARYGVANQRTVITFVALDTENPNSILSCLRSARENSRAVRERITTEVWETINETYHTAKSLTYKGIIDQGLANFFNWVKERSHLFRGVTVGTMVHDHAFQFGRLGTFSERADKTARILDVKYHVLLPQTDPVGGGLDYYQWGAVLQSVGAFEAYRRIYRTGVSPRHVAELLILNADVPRSLHASLDGIIATLDNIESPVGGEANRLAGLLHSQLHFGRIDLIFEKGLHEFLTGFIAGENDLGNEILKRFLGYEES